MHNKKRVSKNLSLWAWPSRRAPLTCVCMVAACLRGPCKLCHHSFRVCTTVFRWDTIGVEGICFDSWGRTYPPKDVLKGMNGTFVGWSPTDRECKICYVTTPRGAQLQYEDHRGCAAGEATARSPQFGVDELFLRIGSSSGPHASVPRPAVDLTVVSVGGSVVSERLSAAKRRRILRRASESLS